MSDRVFVLRDCRIPIEEAALHVVLMTLTYESSILGIPCSVVSGLHGDAGFESPPIVLRLSTPFKNVTTGSRRAGTVGVLARYTL